MLEVFTGAVILKFFGLRNPLQYPPPFKKYLFVFGSMGSKLRHGSGAL